METLPTFLSRAITKPKPSMLYRKKQTVVHAIQWDNDPRTLSKIVKMGALRVSLIQDTRQLDMKTLEGNTILSLGVWIIREGKGVIYCCDNETFQQNYEKVN